MLHKTKSIFSVLKNENFFRPFTWTDAELYYDIAIQLIELSMSNPVILYKTAKTRVDTCIEIYQMAHKDEVDDRGTLNANRVFANLRDCGWITPTRLTADNRDVISVTNDCSGVISAIRGYTESGDSEMMNHLYSIHDILKDVLNQKDGTKSGRRTSPYHSIYMQLIHHRDALNRELVELFNNIDDISNSISSAADPSEYYGSFLDGTAKEKFFAPYTRMKDGGHLKYLTISIREKLEKLREDDELANRTAEQLVYVNSNYKTWEAKNKILNDYSDMETYFADTEISGFHQMIKEIDNKLTAYITSLTSKFTYIFSSHGTLQEHIDTYLSRVETNGLKNAPNICDAVHLNSIKGISEESMRMPRETMDAGTSSMVIDKVTMSDEEKVRRTAALKDSMSSKYSMKRIAIFLDELLGDKNELTLENNNIVDKETALMFASAITFSGAKEFKFKCYALDYYIENDEIRMKNIRIERM